jgi:hypothetical protein
MLRKIVMILSLVFWMIPISGCSDDDTPTTDAVVASDSSSDAAVEMAVPPLDSTAEAASDGSQASDSSGASDSSTDGGTD